MRMAGFLSLAQKLTAAERSLHSVCPERAFLHWSIPFVLLITDLVPISATAIRRGRINAAWQPSRTLHDLDDAVECRCYGNGQVRNPSAIEPSVIAVLTFLFRANKMDSKVPWAVTGICAPVMALKQWINVVQLVEASKWLADGDIDNRRKQGLPRRFKQR